MKGTYAIGYLIYGAILALTAAGEVFRFVVGPSPEIALVFFSLAAGGGSGLAIKEIIALRQWQKRDKQRDKLAGLLPDDINVNHNDDDTDTLIITRQNGDIFTLVTPEGYHPTQDGGQWIIEQIIPEELLHDVRMVFRVMGE